MTYSPEKIAAYQQLEAAIENLRAVYFAEAGETPNVLTGWILLTSAVEFMGPRPDDPHVDDVDLQSSSGWYTRRGQDPTLSYGIINEGLRHYDQVQQGED